MKSRLNTKHRLLEGAEPSPPGVELVPGYEQVKQYLKQQIQAGALRPGLPVPSEAMLVKQFALSRMTVNRALRELASEGLVDRVQGSGTTVAQLHRVSSRLEIRDIHQQIIERGHSHSTKLVLNKQVIGAAAVCQQLELPSRSKVFHTILVHSENAIPLQFEERFVNPAVAPLYLKNDFTTISPTSYLLQHAPLSAASYSIAAQLPSEREAHELDIAPTEACLVMSRRTISGKQVASIARLVYPGSRYRFDGDFLS